jgi:hypothetical protein
LLLCKAGTSTENGMILSRAGVSPKPLGLKKPLFSVSSDKRADFPDNQ